jgi:hypothetical protein
MNPLEWKREHQVALLLCAGIGLIFGFVFGLYTVRKYGYQYEWATLGVATFSDLTADILYWCAVGILAVFGALIGAAVIYSVQLMRT